MDTNNSKNTQVLVGALVGLLLLGGVVLAYKSMNKTEDEMMNDNMSMNDDSMMEDDSMANDESTMEDDAMMEEEGVMVGGAMMVPSKDIVENAMNANNVTTLVAAVKAADLVETLQGEGPFTVFAPTNDAFAKVDKATLDSLLLPANKAQLTSILTYHVVPGRYTSKDLTNGMKLTTVQGQQLTISVMNGKVMVNNTSTVQTADVISSNGVTHVVDTVLMPTM